MVVPSGRDRTRSEVDLAIETLASALMWSAEQRRKARRICYRAVFTECDFYNYANRSVPGSIDMLPNDGYPSHGGDLNSVGIFQQRDQWWGSTEGSMDPAIATARFLSAMLRNQINWLTTNESTVCQNLQQSQFDGMTTNPVTKQPYPFAANYQERTAQVDELENDHEYFTKRGG